MVGLERQQRWLKSLKKNTDSKAKIFEAEFTEQYIEEMISIYDYIAIELKENKIAKRIIKEINEKVLSLSTLPELYTKVGKIDRLSREYHRMVVKNYIVLYTIDYNRKKVYVSRIIYHRRNY